jgi:predicted secreted acid phosphatase
MKLTARQIQANCEFRTNLWKEFVTNYQTVILAGPEAFSRYCERFRERWVAGA